MSDEQLGLNRDQYEKLTDDPQVLRQFEALFGRSNEIVGLQDGINDNTLGIATLSDLVRPITAFPLQPLTAQVSADTIYTIPTTATIKTIWIPSAFLVASSGGPRTLTITTGSGTVVAVPIAGSGDTILSGDLLFDVQVDSSGNVSTKPWDVSGSNSNGDYMKFSDGTMECRFIDTVVQTTSVVSSGMFVSAGVGFNFPKSFISPPIVVPTTGPRISGIVWGVLDTSITSGAVSLRLAGMVNTGQAVLGYVAYGAWRT